MSCRFRFRQLLGVAVTTVAGVLPACADADEPAAPLHAMVFLALEPAQPLPLPKLFDNDCLTCALTPLRLEVPALELALATPSPLESATDTVLSRFRLELAATGAESAEQLPQALPFRDREPLVNRLRRIQAVPFFTLWDTTAASLYLGVDRHGEPGLHLRQKKQDRGSRLAPGMTFLDGLDLITDNEH